MNVLNKYHFFIQSHPISSHFSLQSGQELGVPKEAWPQISVS